MSESLVNPAVGDVVSLTLVDRLTRAQIAMYAGASGDFNPVHVDELYAQNVGGYRSVFAHGLLTMALSGRLLNGWGGPTHLERLGARFIRQVWPGDTLTGSAVVRSVGKSSSSVTVEVDTAVHNQFGQSVLSGYASLRLPV